MTEASDFIEGFLQHAQSKEDIKRYNREYYLRNRKLKGRVIDRSGPVFEQGKGVVRPRPKSAAAEARVVAAEKKIRRARIAASKLPPKKRNAVMRQLVAAQKKLNNLKKRFGTTTKVRVRGIEDFPKAFPKKKR